MLEKIKESAAFLRAEGIEDPEAGVVLGTEDSGSVAASAFNNLQQIVRLLRRKAADQPLVQNEQINLLVSLNGLFEVAAGLGQAQFLQ